MKVITLTLNPAYDMHCYTAVFQPFHENLAEICSYDAGGKGINISRGLLAGGIENTAYVLAGAENCNDFLEKLQAEGISYREFVVPGRIRENITLHTKDQPETRISFGGFCASDAAMDDFQSMLIAEDLKDSVVTCTGRIPKGITLCRVKKLLLLLKSKGAKIVIDSRSFSAEDILEVQPWLIKPNEEEVQEYYVGSVTDVTSAICAAKTICAKGVENVLISLGKQGAVLSCQTGVYFAKALDIRAVSTIGAGDSMIAGFITAIASGKSCAEALCYGVAYGSAACLTEGTAAPKREVIHSFLNSISVEKF